MFDLARTFDKTDAAFEEFDIPRIMVMMVMMITALIMMVVVDCWSWWWG